MGHKVVLDTNVLVSGLIVSQGPSAKILDATQKGELETITSNSLLQELSEVIARPHIVRKYPRVTEHAESVIDYLRTHSTIVEGKPSQQIIKDDPDDDFVIACALDGKADYIVSGDPHLLALAQYGKIKILSPRQFVETVMAEKK